MRNSEIHIPVMTPLRGKDGRKKNKKNSTVEGDVVCGLASIVTDGVAVLCPQYNHLQRDTTVDLVQDYHFGRPRPAKFKSHMSKHWPVPLSLTAVETGPISISLSGGASLRGRLCSTLAW